MIRPSLAARLACTALFGASLLLAACGDDGDGGDAAGGTSGSGSPLSGLLSGFGTPGASNPTAAVADAGAGGSNGAGGAEASSDAGVVEPVIPVQPVSENCAKVCARIVECMPEGCPNFELLPDDTQNQTIADCESKCDPETTDAQYDFIRRLSCDRVTAELLMAPDVAAFCALVPAPEDLCDQFCDLITDCNPSFPRESCALACLYSADGVACVAENGCQSDACARFFPEDD